MKETLPKPSRRYPQLVGALACAGSIAYLQWCLNRDSVGGFENWILVRYLLLNLVCLLLPYFAIKLMLSTDATRFFSSLTLAVVGALLSALLIDVPFVLNSFGYREIAEGNRNGTIQTIVAAFVLNAVVAVVTMSIVCGVAAVVRSFQSEVPLHHGGI